MADDIDGILASRDNIASGLDQMIDAITPEFAKPGLSRDEVTRLSARQTALVNERHEVFVRATDEVLALPGVVAAAGKLTKLGQDMNKAAGPLRRGTTLLEQSATVLGVAQKFVDVVTGSQKV